VTFLITGLSRSFVGRVPRVRPGAVLGPRRS
jgi:hypothetical protein